jgi:uncharacterized membrane protein YgdD (TMEM256/DUF423 family)
MEPRRLGGSKENAMPKSRPWLAFAAVSGFLAVALGAFGAHGLGETLDAHGRELWEKAVLYHMFHTVVLLAIAALSDRLPVRPLRFSGGAFVIGIVVFSGTLYLLALGGPNWLGAITPIGGTAFLAGWAGLVWSAVEAARSH